MIRRKQLYDLTLVKYNMADVVTYVLNGQKESTLFLTFLTSDPYSPTDEEFIDKSLLIMFVSKTKFCDIRDLRQSHHYANTKICEPK